jgi:plasmid stabilization system protein ParE
MMLARNPGAGRLRLEIDPGVRSFPAGAYIVYYRMGKGGRVTIARVLHGSRDQAAAYDEEG